MEEEAEEEWRDRGKGSGRETEEGYDNWQKGKF